MSMRIETASQQLIAAVRLRIAPQEIAHRFRDALDKVWALLRERPAMRGKDGHNVFVYRADGSSDFGVQVIAPFDAVGDVFCSFTPAGRVATTIHRGAYARLGETHAALRRWCDDNNHRRAGIDWEIYGDWNDDPQQLETRICYLLEDRDVA